MSLQPWTARGSRPFFTAIVVLVLMIVGLMNGSASRAATPPDASGARPRDIDGGEITLAVPDTGEIAVARIGPFDEAATTGGISAATVLPPDDFGYAFSEGPMSWIDATGGTDAGFVGSSYNRRTGPVSLPFAFPFYERSFDQIYIAASGYLSFGDSANWPSQVGIGSPALPNGIISPYSTPLYFMPNGQDGRVFYTSGGSAPNRYFVVEWHNVKGGPASDGYGGDDTYRFETILWENGNVDFRYQWMDINSGYWCGYIGIEDPSGLDWTKLPGCRTVTNYAPHFQRPVDAPRAKSLPNAHGQLARAGDTLTYQVPITNAGPSAESIWIEVTSVWPLSLYEADGVTPLPNAGSYRTTGSLAPGATKSIVAKVSVPTAATVDASNHATLTLRPASSPSTNVKTVGLQAVVPTDFAQTFSDTPVMGANVLLAKPVGNILTNASAGSTASTSYQTIVETEEGFFVAWVAGRTNPSTGWWIMETFGARLNHFGDVIAGPYKLTDYSSSPYASQDSDLAVSRNSNGSLALAWRRYDGQSVNINGTNVYQSRYNEYLAIYDDSAPNGVALPPTDLTGSTAFGAWRAIGVPTFYAPSVAATDDGRFVVAWERYDIISGGSLDDVYYTVRGGNGAVIKPVAKLTADTTSTSDGYWHPSALGVAGNRALIIYRSAANVDLMSVVLNSDGSVARSASFVTTDGTAAYENGPIALARLSDTRTAIAWKYYDSANSDLTRVVGAVLDEGFFRTGATQIFGPGLAGGADYPNLTSDSNGRAVLTFVDGNYGRRMHLSYAVFDQTGTLNVPPTAIWRARGATNSGTSYALSTNWNGRSSTTYRYAPPAAADSKVQFKVTAAPAAPGGVAALNIQYANHGSAWTSGLTLTATLDPNLTYVSDTSGVTPTIGSAGVLAENGMTSAASGQTLTWHLADIGYLEGADFKLLVRLPVDAPLNTAYPVALTLTATGAEFNPADNSAVGSAIARALVYLPMLSRP